MKDPEAPPTHPCGPNTSFQFKTPMPYQFQKESVPKANAAKAALLKEEHPIYQTSSSEVGKLMGQDSDLHMRWYGLNGAFTNFCTAGGAALSKHNVKTGLNTAMDRSDHHPTFDQGWSGHLGQTDFNVRLAAPPSPACTPRVLSLCLHAARLSRVSRSIARPPDRLQTESTPSLSTPGPVAPLLACDALVIKVHGRIGIRALSLFARGCVLMVHMDCPLDI